jgi:hypothetical protein
MARIRPEVGLEIDGFVLQEKLHQSTMSSL